MVSKIIRKILYFFIGATVLIVFSIIQKKVAGFPLKLVAFQVPFWFGGSTGLIIGILFERIQIKNKLLKIAFDKAEESNRLKNIFINNLSHEIRTPMNSIIGFSELLNEANCNPQNKKYANYIEQSSLQLLKIVENLLEISALQTMEISVNKTQFNLLTELEYLHSALNKLAIEKTLNFIFDYSSISHQKTIETDKQKFNKIIFNITENSIKFTNKGKVEVIFICKNDILFTTISDTGIGIAQENQEIIFEPFVQENQDISVYYGGMGIGLSIAKMHVTLLNGTLELFSEKNKGTKISISLPC